MIDRRKLVNSALIASAAVVTSAASTEAAAQQSGNDVVRVANAIDDFRRLIENELDPTRGMVAQIRVQQRTYLRANQKYPDFIDIGPFVWEQVYDWHIRFQQPVMVTRMNDGRYGMAFQLTTLVLRPEQPDSYISLPYDLR